MPDDATEVAFSQAQPESQTSTQPLEEIPAPTASKLNRASIGRCTTDGSFHSAQENIRLRGQTVKPMDIDPKPSQNREVQQPKTQLKEPEPEPEHEAPSRSEPEPHPTMSEPAQSEPVEPELAETEAEPEPQFTGPEPAASEPAEPEPVESEPVVPESQPKEPEPAEPHHKPAELKLESKPAEPERTPEPKHGPATTDKQAMEPEPKQDPEPEPEPVPDTRSSPANTPAIREEESQHAKRDIEKEEMVLDDLDDIGSPSDGSTPEPMPIRKSSLTFASLPARDPLPTKKSIGGSRISRTSHVDLLNAGRSSYFGRQTGGHRTTQFPEESGDQMDVDEREILRENTDEDSRASQMHSKSSTQRLHEKISMLGKLQPSRPTKSIPSVARLSSAQVAYPELPTAKAEPTMEASSQRPRDGPPPSAMATEEDDWIKPLGTPRTPHRLNFPRSHTMDLTEKETSQAAGMAGTNAVRPKGSNNGQPTRSNTLNLARERSGTPVLSTPRQRGHQKSPSVSHLATELSTTPGGSPRRYEGPLSASKFKLQSIMKSAKGLFTSSAGVSAAARAATSSPTPSRDEPHDRVDSHAPSGNRDIKPSQPPSPPRQEGRRTRSSTEREEKRRQEEMRRQKELEERRREEERLEKLREQEIERQKAAQAKAAQEKSSTKQEERTVSAHVPTAMASTKKVSQPQRQASREPESSHDTGSKLGVTPASQLRKPNDRRPVKPTREPIQKSQPQPVSIRVGSALSRQIPLASSAFSSSVQDSNPPAATPASVSKPPSIRKKASNTSLHTASSTGSFKSTVSSQSQRKAQLANERKREQEEREARRKEEQKRELARKRAAQQQQQEEARRRERERLAEDPKRAAQMQEIEKRRMMNARRLDRQGSQQPSNELVSCGPQDWYGKFADASALSKGSILQHEKAAPPSSQRGDLGASRPASRLGSIQSFSRPITPAPNPAKPPKRHLDEEAHTRPPAPNSSSVQPSGESKRRKTEEDHHNQPPVRPTMAPPIRQSNIRKVRVISFVRERPLLTWFKEPSKPSMYGHGKVSMSQAGSSIFKTAPHAGPSQTQRLAHPMDMAKYTSGKIPFAEPPPNPPAQQQQQHKTPSANSQRAPPKPSPKYPNGENINLPEIPTDSEDEDSETEILPVPKWAQPKELDAILRQQEGMEADSIFGPIAPFSLEETFKSDKRIKKFRDRTSSANWSGADGLTQEEIRRDLAERQRMRLNGGWSMT